MTQSDKLSVRDRTAMGLPADGSDPTPRRRALLEYIEEHGPLIAHHMTPAGVGCKQRLVWLSKEGYISSEKSGTKCGLLWSITALGKRWIAPTRGELVPPRTIAFTGCATESRDVVWPDVRGGSMRAFELHSRGME